MIISDSPILLKVVIQWFVYSYSIITQDEGQRSLCIVRYKHMCASPQNLCRKDVTYAAKI